MKTTLGEIVSLAIIGKNVKEIENEGLLSERVAIKGKVIDVCIDGNVDGDWCVLSLDNGEILTLDFDDVFIVDD